MKQSSEEDPFWKIVFFGIHACLSPLSGILEIGEDEHSIANRYIILLNHLDSRLIENILLL